MQAVEKEEETSKIKEEEKDQEKDEEGNTKMRVEDYYMGVRTLKMMKKNKGGD